MALIDNHEACLALIEQSPAAVTAQDPHAWLNLFADKAQVEDPVGSRPNTHDGDLNNGALARFYKTFIHNNKIIFNVDHDIVQDGMVMRDLSMEIQMSAKITVNVPMHLLYELAEQGGELKIKRLAAHWELAPMSKQLMSKGIAAIPVLLNNTIKMLRHLGLSGTQGFMEARKQVGEQGKSMAKAFVAERYPTATIEKILAAGNTVTASLYDQDSRHYLGVLLVTIDPSDWQISHPYLFKKV